MEIDDNQYVNLSCTLNNQKSDEDEDEVCISSPIREISFKSWRKLRRLRNLRDKKGQMTILFTLKGELDRRLH